MQKEKDYSLIEKAKLNKNSPILIVSELGNLESGIINSVTALQAGWDLLNMEVRRLRQDEDWLHNTKNYESVIVILGGKCSVYSHKEEWLHIGHREHVFAGMPYALYLPPNTEFKLTANSGTLEIAHCWVQADQSFAARLVTPQDSKIEIRGGSNATRQINSIIGPEFPNQKIIAVEVYTPGGNWSSYPPHKHDKHIVDEKGLLLEADLEEIYYYKIDKPSGYAIQRVYTDNRDLDEVVVAHNNDIVLVPEGYHPVSAAYGYNCYYLNFLAGSAKSLACQDDPVYAWTKETWSSKDPRVPMVNHGM